MDAEPDSPLSLATWKQREVKTALVETSPKTSSLQSPEKCKMQSSFGWDSTF